MNTDTDLEKFKADLESEVDEMTDEEILERFVYKKLKYTLNPSASIYDNILLVFKMKMVEEKNEFEYINPNFMREVLDLVEGYSHEDVDDDIWNWVQEMYGA